MRFRRAAAIMGVLAMAAPLISACGSVRESVDAYLPDCSITVGEDSVYLDREQAANAATITAVGLRRGIPEYGLVVALATAWQESKLHNIDYGDRDSLGLFQQRPSQGWGTEEEVMDPRYAATKFFEHLERIPYWESMRVTDAAQAVQLSAYPEEYEQWAADSQVMVTAYIGDADGALTCRHNGATATDPSVGTLVSALLDDWGDDTIYTEGDTDLLVPVNTPRDGWQYASWLVAHSHAHGVTGIEYNGTAWSSADGEWTATESGEGDPHAVIAIIGTDTQTSD